MNVRILEIIMSVKEKFRAVPKTSKMENYISLISGESSGNFGRATRTSGRGYETWCFENFKERVPKTLINSSKISETFRE